MLFCYLFIALIIVVRQRRGCSEIEFVEQENRRFLSSSVWLFIGWALHYFPFYGMGRILYFHHYFPAAIFSSMLTAVIIDYLLKVIPVLVLYLLYRKSDSDTLSARYHSVRMVFHFLYGSLLSALSYSFYLFSPLAYGIIRLPTSSTGNSSAATVFSSVSGPKLGEMSEYVDYSNEQSMQSLRWMESWEF